MATPNLGKNPRPSGKPATPTVTKQDVVHRALTLQRILKSTKSHDERWRVVFKVASLVDEAVIMDVQNVGKDWLNAFYVSLKAEINALGNELFGDAYPYFEEVERYKALVNDQKFKEAKDIEKKQRADYKRNTNKYWYPRYRQCLEKMNSLKTSHPIGYKIYQKLLPYFQHLKSLEDNQRHRYMFNRMNKWWTS